MAGDRELRGRTGTAEEPFTRTLGHPATPTNAPSHDPLKPSLRSALEARSRGLVWHCHLASHMPSHRTCPDGHLKVRQNNSHRRSPKRYLDVRPASGSRDTKMSVSGTANRPPNSVSFSPRSPSFIEMSRRSGFPNRNYTVQSPLHSVGPCDHFSTTEGEQKE